MIRVMSCAEYNEANDKREQSERYVRLWWEALLSGLSAACDAKDDLELVTRAATIATLAMEFRKNKVEELGMEGP